MQSFRLETQRLVLRRPCAADLDPYTRYCLSDRTRYVGGPFGRIQAFDKLAAMIGHWDLRGFGRFVAVTQRSERQIGHVGALQLDPEGPPEMTWTIWDAGDEGKGYAIEACRAYADHARTHLGFRRMIARIHRDNQRSRRLAEMLGGVLTPDAARHPLSDFVTYDLDLPDAG